MKRRRVLASSAMRAGVPARAFAQTAPAAPTAPRRIAILMAVKQGDPEGEGSFNALRTGLAERGWVDGSTARPAMSIASCAAPSRRICWRRRRPSTPYIVNTGTARELTLPTALLAQCRRGDRVSRLEKPPIMA